jgi:hypothetical protein
VFKAWPRYWQLPKDEWVKVMTRVMVSGFLYVILKEKRHRGRLRGPDTDPDSCSCLPKNHVANEDLWDHASTIGQLLDP